MITVKKITNKQADPFILYKHYAKRRPSISYAYGLIIDNEIKGVCCYGQPGGVCLSKGLFGGEYRKQILELNRLFIDEDVTIYNVASQLVSQSIKMLPSPLCIVSFADTSVGHNGIIYQATNFLYTGLSAKRTEWAIKGMEHLHSKSIADKAKKGGGRWDALKDEYGDRLYKRDRPRKHRYIYIKGNKREKKIMLNKLKYKPIPYPPKKESTRYQVGEVPQNKITQQTLYDIANATIA